MDGPASRSNHPSRPARPAAAAAAAAGPVDSALYGEDPADWK